MFVFIVLTSALLLAVIKWRALAPVLQNIGKVLFVSAIYLVFLARVVKSVLIHRSV